MKKRIISGLLILLLVVSALIPNMNIQAASVKLNKTKATLYVSESIKLRLTGNKSKIIWKTSDKSIATVSDGKVTAKSSGTATITAITTNNKKKYSCNVTVKKRLSANKYTVNCDLNDDFQEITVSYKKLNKNETISYEIKNDGIATIESEELSNNKLNLYIIPNKTGSTKLKISTVIIDTHNSYYASTIEETDSIEITINVGISDSDEWIGEETLDSVYDIFITVSDDQIGMYKRRKNSISGLTDFVYQFKYESNYKENTVYGTELRYKFIDDEIYFNITDLEELNIISR